MKRFLEIFASAFLVLSCGPSRYAIPVEMRHSSKSGLELGGKVVSVVHTDAGENGLDTFSENMADAFAEVLENEYGTGKGSVGVYSVDGSKGTYSNKDSLVSILMTTGSDMVFLFDSPKLMASSSTSLPLNVTLYCFDGMDKSETVHKFSGSTMVTSIDSSQAASVGKKVAQSFSPQWKQEQYSIAYFDSEKWYEALVKAEQYDWKGAMDIWFTLLDSNDMMKRACAEYNIAVSCYMLGDPDLALQWLDRSDSDNKMPTLSDALRKRIEARKR